MRLNGSRARVDGSLGDGVAVGEAVDLTTRSPGGRRTRTRRILDDAVAGIQRVDACFRTSTGANELPRQLRSGPRLTKRGSVDLRLRVVQSHDDDAVGRKSATEGDGQLGARSWCRLRLGRRSVRRGRRCGRGAVHLRRRRHRGRGGALVGASGAQHQPPCGGCGNREHHDDEERPSAWGDREIHVFPIGTAGLFLEGG